MEIRFRGLRHLHAIDALLARRRQHPTHRSICAQAGETYLVPPGHIPVMNEDAVMVEFTQDTTYTNAEVQAKMKD